MRSPVSIGILLLFGALGCAADKPALEAPTLSDPSKADDGGEEIVPIGELAFGGEVLGEILAEGQYDGYTFDVEAGGRVTLDNTNAGTAQRLDSTLFVYGPSDENGFYGADPIATDDDSGWGTHARIRDFAIPLSGQYMVVIGVSKGSALGRYRLTLTCESETCARNVATPDIVREVSDLEVAEDGTTRTFRVRLTTEPTSAVHIWMESDQLDEAQVYPTRAYFCPSATHLEGNTCASDTGDDAWAERAEWDRVIEVRVAGVADRVDDGDVPFNVVFRIESDDPAYGSMMLSPFPGVNFGRSNAPDYSDLEALRDEGLLQALFARVDGHETFGYQGANSARTLMFGSVDLRNGVIESLYTGEVIDAPGESILAYMRGFNTEHSWPQGQFGRLDPMVSDLHHIFPTDIESNGSRASYGFGFNTDPVSPSSSLGISTTDSRERVYQVRPERRGDIARAHFYMVARYAFDTSLGIMFDDDATGENGRIEDLEEAVLREWHESDPVDTLERSRNERIHALQGNRNPFIDRPDFVERVANF